VNILQNYRKIKREMNNLSSTTKLIVVCKNQKLANILPILEDGHVHFGENRVQEAKNKWKLVDKKFSNIKLHFIGKIQSNKVKELFGLFHFVHSLDSQKLAKCFSEEENKLKIKLKYFIQVNIGDEPQKSGVAFNDCENLLQYCKTLNLDIIGLMCIPPVDKEPKDFFIKLSKLNKFFNLKELSMGMSSDYKEAVECGSTFVRVGSAIFS
jgi:pyridoxal phosphate enzyme (YggS family)